MLRQPPPPPPEADKVKDDADFWFGLALFITALVVGGAAYLLSLSFKVAK